LNRALEAARAPYLARMDADDLAHPERLQKQVAGLGSDSRVAILGCRVKLQGAPGGRAGMRRYVGWQNGLVTHEAIVRDLLVESPLAHPSVMMRSTAIRALGGYRVFDGPEDYDLWLRAHRAGLRFAKLPEVLLTWRDDAGRVTRTDPRYAPDRFRELKLEALEHAHLPPGRGVVLWGAGPIGKAWARALARRGRSVEAFVEVHPRRLGRTIHGARVISVEAARINGPLHLAAVGQAGARARIRAAAGGLGLIEGRDLVAVA
jgi:hypothetical protein